MRQSSTSRAAAPSGMSRIADAYFSACSIGGDPDRYGKPAASSRDPRTELPRSPRWRLGRSSPSWAQRSRLEKELEMRKVFEIGGIVAAAVLVAFGIAA